MDEKSMIVNRIAVFYSPFTAKFGIPKQSGLAADLRGTIVFEQPYRSKDYIRGLEGFDFAWLIWGFSANRQAASSPVVRPPVLGGNEKMGVFATRSPYRPNPIGLSSVRIDGIEENPQLGSVVHVLGADLMDGTPIYDIKPYVGYSDCHVGAKCGFVDSRQWPKLEVVMPAEYERLFTPEQLCGLRESLSLDPRPHYHDDGQRVYGVEFAGRDVHFQVADGVLTVTGVAEIAADRRKR